MRGICNMGKILLVTGGSRSGKSAYALKVGQAVSGPRTFIATCPLTDDEMKRRIEAHQLERSSGNWKTVEEQVALGEALEREKTAAVVIVDCLTLWVNNILYETQKTTENLTEATMTKRSRELLYACRNLPGLIIFVTNEIGMGIVPENKQTRLYRDLIGRCNQTIAAGADAVVMVICGIATFIKGKREGF